MLYAYLDDDIGLFKSIWGFDDEGKAVPKKNSNQLTTTPDFLIPFRSDEDEVLMSILKFACIQRKLDFMKVIVQHPQVDINLLDEYGVNALFYAV